MDEACSSLTSSFSSSSSASSSSGSFDQDQETRPTSPHFIRSRYPAGPPTQCPVCSARGAVHRHFGGCTSCNGCAAFFRRTIVERKNYRCRRWNNCDLKKAKGNPLCRACRFKKCLTIGMTMEAVEPKRLKAQPADPADSPLKALCKSRQAIFSSRHKAAIDVCGERKKFKMMAHHVKNAFSVMVASSAEVRVMREFVRGSGLLLEDDIRHNTDLQLCQHSLLTWLTLEGVLSNLRQQSFRTNRCYYIDDSYIEMSEDLVVSYLRTYPSMTYHDQSSRYCYNFYAKIRQIAEKMYNARLDEMEITALSLVLILQKAMPVLNDYYREQLNQVFRDLKTHYEENYQDVAIRLGNLMLFVDEMMGEITQIRDEMVIVMRLNDKQYQNEFGVHHFMYDHKVCRASDVSLDQQFAVSLMANMPKA